MFQETWKAGSEVRENESITFLEHGLTTKVCPRGSQGVPIARQVNIYSPVGTGTRVRETGTEHACVFQVSESTAPFPGDW